MSIPLPVLHAARLVAAVVVLCGASACDRGQASREAGAVFRGVVLNRPIEKPDVTLTDFNGAPFNLRLQTAGKVTLLFFGYTHCPDVCPLHAANVAAVLRQMPFEEKAKIQFVFVTTDPTRDTPARLKEWLGNFDPSFVGLTGPTDVIARLQTEVGIPPAQKQVPPGADSASYLVGHGAQVIAFGLDGFAHVEYPFGIRQEDWASELPRLARGETPLPAPAPTPGSAAEVTLRPSDAPPTDAPPIQVETALMAAPASTSEAAVYLVLHNAGAADTLTAVSSPDAQMAMIHRTSREGSTMRMSAVDRVPIAAGGTLRFVPGETHVMLMQLTRKPVAGESFPLRLRFALAGEYVIAPMVVSYAELDSLLRPAR